jgi:hypothetical protein
MPDSTILAPLAADPIDRLTLGANDAREIIGAQAFPSALLLGPTSSCMAEE